MYHALHDDDVPFVSFPLSRDKSAFYSHRQVRAAFLGCSMSRLDVWGVVHERRVTVGVLCNRLVCFTKFERSQQIDLLRIQAVREGGGLVGVHLSGRRSVLSPLRHVVRRAGESTRPLRVVEVRMMLIFSPFVAIKGKS